MPQYIVPTAQQVKDRYNLSLPRFYDMVWPRLGSDLRTSLLLFFCLFFLCVCFCCCSYVLCVVCYTSYCDSNLPFFNYYPLNLQLRMPEDYHQWYIMMESEFGTRFSKLFRGPAWSGCDRADFKYTQKVNLFNGCFTFILQ